ncbi:MAG TPA: hypothetical protein VMZ28_24250 [Kofleriaceae bacterium]|nr:hypothetical protein [Kofleriaceae bacterium]
MSSRRVALALSLLLTPACAGGDDDGGGGGGGGGGDGDLVGEVRTGQGQEDLEVVVLWEVPGESFAIGTRLGVTAPSDFTIDLSHPPPEATLADEVWNPDEPDQYGPVAPRIAQGYVAAFEPGALDDPDLLAGLGDFMDDRMRGMVSGTMLVYLEGDVEAGTYMEQYLCGTPAAGYHVTQGELAYAGDFADCDAFPGGSESGDGAMMVVTPDDLATRLAIELWPAE